MLKGWHNWVWVLFTLAGGAVADQIPASPEQVHIYAIGGKAMAKHPSQINVLPGEKITLEADVLQFGNACPHPEGCPEGRDADQFIWNSDNGTFETVGRTVVFHIPSSMAENITITVGHKSLSTTDTIVLHNARFANSFREAPPDYYNNEQPVETHVYPAVVVVDPFWYPYWSPYWAYYPYPYWRPWYHPWVGWGGGFGGPYWSVGFGWGWHPGWYGYYPGWWHPHYYAYSGPRYIARAPVRFAAPGARFVRPMAPAPRPSMERSFSRRRNRRRW